MKKICLFLTIMLVCSSAAFAVENKDRIQELLNETRRIDQAMLEYQAELNKMTQLKFENVGRIKELQRIEEEKAPKKTLSKDDKKSR